LQKFIENSSTYICEDVNICTVADLSSLTFLFGIYFSQAAVETLKCTGYSFDDKLIVGKLTTSEEKQILHVSFVATLKKKNPYNISLSILYKCEKF